MAPSLRLIAALAVFAALFISPRAAAHSPHDVINVVGITDTGEDRQVLFTIMQLTGRELLGRSFDSGITWTITALPALPRAVSRITFSPSFSQDGTAFIATTDLGILKTTDMGDSWIFLDSGGLDLRVLDLTVSPDFSSDQTLLAATAAGIQRSTDGGLNWTASGAGLVEFVATKVAFAPDDPTVAFAGRQTLHRSTDGGLSWTPLQLFDERFVELSVSPNYSNDLSLVVALENQAGVLSSDDGGNQWLPMVLGLSDPDVNSVALDSAGTVYAVSHGAGVFRGSLGGSFTLVGEGFEELSDLTTDHFRTVSLSSSAGSGGTVWVGTFEGLFASSDQGEHFRQMDIYHQKYVRSIGFAPDYAQTQRVFLQTYGGGLFSSPNYPTPPVPGGASSVTGSTGPGQLADPTVSGENHTGAHIGRSGQKAPIQPGEIWAPRSGVITALFGQCLDFSPNYAEDDTMYYAQSGLWRSTSRGLAWETLPVPANSKVLRALTLSPDFADDQTVLAGAGQAGGAFRSMDGGETWTALTVGLPPVTLPLELLYSPNHLSDSTVYLADRFEGVYVSNDSGDSWTQSDAGLVDLELHAFAMSPDFSRDQTLMAGSATAGLSISVDGGTNWALSNAGLPTDIPLNVESIAFSPNFASDHTVFIAILAGGVFRSVDDGSTWQATGGGLPQDAPRVVALSPDFANDSTLIVSTYNWVYRSQDGGDTFQRLPGYARVDDGNPGLGYELAHDDDNVPGWSHDTAWELEAWIVEGKPAAQAIAVSRSDDSGDAVEYRFVGDSIRWYAPLAPDQGMAQIFLDGDPVELVDLYGPHVEGAAVRFEKLFPTLGAHTIRVENSGLANPQASDTILRSDGFDNTY